MLLFLCEMFAKYFKCVTVIEDTRQMDSDDGIYTECFELNPKYSKHF